MSDDEVDLKDKLIDQAKSAGCKKAWDLYESCKTRVTVGEHAGNAEANCTAFFLDFMKCADAAAASSLFSQLK